MGPWDLIPWPTRSARHWASAKSLHLRCPLQSKQCPAAFAELAPHPGSWSLLSPPRLPYPIPTLALISLPLLGVSFFKRTGSLELWPPKAHPGSCCSSLKAPLYPQKRRPSSWPAIPSFPSPRLCPLPAITLALLKITQFSNSNFCLKTSLPNSTVTCTRCQGSLPLGWFSVGPSMLYYD